MPRRLNPSAMAQSQFSSSSKLVVRVPVDPRPAPANAAGANDPPSIRRGLLRLILAIDGRGCHDPILPHGAAQVIRAHAYPGAYARLSKPAIPLTRRWSD